MNPNQSSDLDQIFYPMEKDKFSETCQLDPDFVESEDPRYYEIGGKESEYEVQRNSGVLRMLLDLPLYTQYAGKDYKQKKEAIIYKFWGRPTIPWELECEIPKPRQLIFQSMLQAREIDPGASENNETIKTIAKYVLMYGCFISSLAIFRISLEIEH